MEHDQAVSTMTAERYILGELSADERRQFEDHFFDCAGCAGDVRDLSRFVEGSRIVLKAPLHTAEMEVKQRHTARWQDVFKSWRLRPNLGWGVACALFVVTMLTSLQLVELRTQMRPHSLNSFQLRPETRGEITSIAAQRSGPFVLLEADIPGAAGDLKWELRKSGASIVLTEGTAGAPAPGSSFKLLLPSVSLAAGEYQLTVRSIGSSDKQWMYRFIVGDS